MELGVGEGKRHTTRALLGMVRDIPGRELGVAAEPFARASHSEYVSDGLEFVLIARVARVAPRSPGLGHREIADGVNHPFACRPQFRHARSGS